MKPDRAVEKQLEKTARLPQFEKKDGVKFRYCRLCGKKLEAGEAFREHTRMHW